MKVEVAVLGSLSLTVLMASVDVKQHWTELKDRYNRVEVLCES